MRIFTTLLVLLLSSPSVFAETWVCTWLNPNNAIITEQFTRTAIGFQNRVNVGNGNISYLDIVYEDFKVIVLHRTTSSPDSPGFITTIVQIEKVGRQNYKSAFLTTGVELIDEGTCTVVE